MTDTLKQRLDALIENVKTATHHTVKRAKRANLGAHVMPLIECGDLVTKEELEVAVRKRLNDLPWREKDLKRGLILFRTSSNAHGFTNYSSLSSKVDALPDAAKEELAATMTNIALGYSKEEVLANGVVRQAISEAVEVEREACAWIAQNACLVPPDGGSPTEAEADLCDRAASYIRARKGTVA